MAIEGNDISRISAGTIVKGEIVSPGDIRIDGTFEGTVRSEGRVVVGDKAQVKGDIICANVEFRGSMKGNFYVSDTLSLKAGCKVEGDLHVRRLQVELDAEINGSCKMLKDGDFEALTAVKEEE